MQEYTFEEVQRVLNDAIFPLNKAMRLRYGKNNEWLQLRWSRHAVERVVERFNDVPSMTKIVIMIKKIIRNHLCELAYYRHLETQLNVQFQEDDVVVTFKFGLRHTVISTVFKDTHETDLSKVVRITMHPSSNG